MGGIKRVLVTGAAGFIGSRLTQCLLKNGYETGIIVRDGSDTSRFEQLPGRLSVFRGDIRNGDEVSRIISGFLPDCILHLVTYYAVEHVPQEIGIMVDTNVRGTINLLEAARINGVKLFVNTSTCAVYEQKDDLLSEDDPVSPQNLYALTKFQAEEACRFYALNYGVDGVSLRLFPPYGPGDHERRLIPYVIRSFYEGKIPNLTTGRQKWDFVYIDDVVNAFLSVLKAFPFKKHYDEINIGTGNPVSVRDMVLMIMEMMGRESELPWGSVPHRKNEVWFNSADIRKSNEVLGWEPSTDVREGLQKTIAWFTKKNDAGA